MIPRPATLRNCHRRARRDDSPWAARVRGAFPFPARPATPRVSQHLPHAPAGRGILPRARALALFVPFGPMRVAPFFAALAWSALDVHQPVKNWTHPGGAAFSSDPATAQRETVAPASRRPAAWRGPLPCPAPELGTGSETRGAAKEQGDGRQRRWGTSRCPGERSAPRTTRVFMRWGSMGLRTRAARPITVRGPRSKPLAGGGRIVQHPAEARRAQTSHRAASKPFGGGLPIRPCTGNATASFGAGTAKRIAPMTRRKDGDLFETGKHGKHGK